MTEELSKKVQATQEYSVLITDEQSAASGSGLLYYPGGDVFYVFTCRHVVTEIESEELTIYLLLPIDPKTDEYTEAKIVVPRSQVVFPPEEEHDFAVIYCRKEEGLFLKPSAYLVNEANKNLPVYAHGFPGGLCTGEALLEGLDHTKGTIIRCMPKNHRFTLRCEDEFIDQGNRNYELEGYSGSPVWESSGEVLSVTGILSAGVRKNTYRSRIYAEKMEYIRSFMKNRFRLYMRTKLEAIPESDVMEELPDMVQFSGTVIEYPTRNEADSWIGQQRIIVRGLIDDLQYRKAIDTIKAVIEEEKFKLGSQENRRLMLQHLLYCYEILMWEDEFVALEKQMHQEGLIDGHDYLRSITSAFGRKEYQKSIEYADEWLLKSESDDEKQVLADTFKLLSRIYVENLSYEESIGSLLDEKDNLRTVVSNAEVESLLYQMIGYVLSDCFRRFTQAIRCLNKSYRVGFDKMVLETLAGVYHDYAISNAVDKENIVNAAAIDRPALYKARECFLLIMDKADDLFWESTIKRMGMVIYDTFFFSADNYRIIRTYPYIKSILGDHLSEKELRDVEIKYARIDCLRGNIDFSQYQHLTEQDKKLFALWVDMHAASVFFCDNPPAVLRLPAVENQLKTTLQNAENMVDRIDAGEKLAVRNVIINLYGRGIFTYGWDVVDKIKYHLEEMRKYADPELIDTMEVFLLECEKPFDEVEGIFRERFRKKQDLISWHELKNLYLRHFKFDEIDRLYKELFSEYNELVKTDSEFILRDYIDYVTHYQRDIKDALLCYLNAGEMIMDQDIRSYWELELMLYTNTFNDPDRFEEDRLSYLNRGLITPEIYHKGAFIAYMCNLNRQKAIEHNIYMPEARRNHFITEQNTPKELIHFLAWQGMIRPYTIAPVNKFMLPQNECWAKKKMQEENWHQDIARVAGRYKLEINRTIAVDAWALCLMAFDGKLDDLKQYDKVYVSHITISRLMEEASKTALYQVHQVLDFIEKSENVEIRSAEFRHQVEIRERMKYGEPESIIAIAVEKDCPAVVGEPELRSEAIENYAHIMIRANEFTGYVLCP